MKKIVLSILFVLVLCGSSNAEVNHFIIAKDILTVDKNQLTKLNGKQIKEKVTDKIFFTLIFTDIENPRDTEIMEDTFYKNGDWLITTKNAMDPTETRSSKGKWKVEKDKICYKYDEYDDDFGCYRMYEKVEGGDTVYYFEYNMIGLIDAKVFRVIDLNKIVEPNTLKLEAELIKEMMETENWTKKQAKCLIKKTKPLVKKEDWNKFVKIMQQDDINDEDVEMILGITFTMMAHYSECGVPLKQ